MLSHNKFICSIAIVVCFSSAAFAIQCNECESNQYSKCRDPFQADPTFQVDCDKQAPPKYLQDVNPSVRLAATGCLKKTFRFEGNTNVVKRSCYWGDKSFTTGCLDDPTKPYLQQVACQVCDTDLCNSSTATGPLAVAIALFAVLVRLIC